jgi:hypothetical protein
MELIDYRTVIDPFLIFTKKQSDDFEYLNKNMEKIG